MDNLYSSFYLYRKYEIIGDELIDLGIKSIDADGTQEPVVKSECDPACGCPEPIYRWVQTEDTVCVGEEPTPASPKFTLTLSDSSIVTAECDSTSAITSGEVATQYSGSVVSAVIGDCVTEIDWAFRNCSDLTSITIPSSITSIGEGAFNYCISLTSVDIPNSVTSIGDGAFQFCTGLTSVVIPDSVTTISSYAFEECRSLTSVVIPDSVTSIGNSAFGYCSGLTSITCLATTPPTLRYYAFDDTNNCPIYVPCESVSAYQAATNWSTYASRIQGIPPCGQPTPTGAKFTLTLSDSSVVTGECDETSAITSGEVATQYSGSVTPALVEAEIGDCVTSIGQAAFINCSGLTSVTIPSSVTSIGVSAFYRCRGLSSVTIPNSVTSIGAQAFMTCYSLTSVNIPTGVTIIESSTFNSCGNLTSINLPSGVTSIGYRAFAWCSGLTSVTIPSGVTSIGDSAFYKCSGLTSITCLATTPPTLVPYRGLYENFSYTNDCPIYVPCESVSAYQAAEGWSDYASRIEGIPPCGQPKVRHIIYDAETATKGYPAVINKNSSSNGRFSDSEGTYFNTIAMEVYEMLCTNNIPLMVEFSQVNDEETIKVADSWWNTFYNSLPISTEEPLAIVLTTDMLERLVGRGLLLLNEYSKQIIVTKVYYEV